MKSVFPGQGGEPGGLGGGLRLMFSPLACLCADVPGNHRGGQGAQSGLLLCLFILIFPPQTQEFQPHACGAAWTFGPRALRCVGLISPLTAHCVHIADIPLFSSE